MYLNKTTLIGNLTRDPEMKALPTGTQVTNFTIATNRTWKDKDGKKQEDVEFHNCVAFGKTGELIKQYMSKGAQIYVEGRLQTRSWEDKDSGKKMYRTEIVVDQMQFGAKRDKDDQTPKNQGEAEDNLPDEDINPEDIPF